MHGCQIHEQERARHSHDQIIVGGRSTNCSICLIIIFQKLNIKNAPLNAPLNVPLNVRLNVRLSVTLNATQ